jgi:hypothetical protein
MGALHRRIEIVTRQTGPDSAEARTAIEDDYHHFRVTIRQQGGRVSEAFSQALRHPTTLCPAAGDRLAELVGMPLSDASAAVNQTTDPRQQCTHQFDIAGLAVAALARGLPRRLYEAAVPDSADGRRTAVLKRDGEIVLQWEMQGFVIEAPAPYAGRDLGGGFTGFARSLPLEDAEAALVLRRAVFISFARGFDLDAPDIPTGPLGGCWVRQPERYDQARRVMGSTWDFSGRDETLLSDDKAWLAFAQ